MSQMKEKEKSPENKTKLNEVEIGNLLGKEFRIMIVTMIQDLRKGMQKRQEMFTKDIEERKKQTDEQYTIMNQ